MSESPVQRVRGDNQQIDVLTLDALPANRTYFEALWAFCEDVLEMCVDLAIAPVMSASLAALAYTGCGDLEVHDVDLSCSEADFPRIIGRFRVLRGSVPDLTRWRRTAA